ncbi:hypothetical protein [Micromonospora ureilytica]|uniref:hypothetical protein n=1 Tax=Micromonospora ureilytica TaxID=709868 RepID=UPI002E127E79|nr:hypothetical protein OHB55_27550 [Micromonospora ureilytica]
MSVDLEATLARPISLAEMVIAARATLAELLGLDTTPELSVADRTGGQFIDDQIQLLRPGHTHPRHMVTATRLPPEPGEFTQRCERYLRQFTHLGAWPRTVSMERT